MKITILHPDLGIGGAERLVVDAALAYKSIGYNVNIITTHHDPDRCFTETKDGTLSVTVVGDWLPRNIFGKFTALCAYLRMMYAAFFIILQESSNLPDLVFCDLVSACVPILKLRVNHVVFYCHHPDKLLTRSEPSWYRTLYRWPLNYFEELSTGRADIVLVNSLYTQQVYLESFKSLTTVPQVIYPSINTDFFDKTRLVALERILDMKLPDDSFVILSINRYERKKNIELAIRALGRLKERFKQTGDNKIYQSIFLIIAGGYDKREEENVEYHLELVELADELDVTDRVIFLRSMNDVAKLSVLSHCNALVYTPRNEHFGIVPLEAMYLGKPVIASNSGGPKESIVDGVTGFLVDDNENAFAEKLEILIRNKELGPKLGEEGKRRFLKVFSFQAFKTKLTDVIVNCFILNLNRNIVNVNQQY